MQLIRGAGAAGRATRTVAGRMPTGRRCRRCARPHGGDDRRCSRRTRRAGLASASSWSREQTGRPILPVAIATIALHRAQHLEPDDDQSAVLEPRLCHRARRAVPREADPEDLESLPAGGRGQPEPRHRSWPTSAPAPILSRATPGMAWRATHRARPASQGLSHADQLWRARSRRCCSSCASGAARRSRRGARSASAGRARAAPGRAGSRGFMPPASARPMPSCR